METAAVCCRHVAVDVAPDERTVFKTITVAQADL